MTNQTRYKKITVLLLASIVIMSSCKKKEEIAPLPPVSEAVDTNAVNVNIDNFPFQTLSEYRFFDGNMVDHEPNQRVYPYKPASQLFTDYALKKRFIWIPEGKAMSYQSDDELFNMPIGTMLIKTFYYENTLPNNTTKLLETRLMLKKDDGWEFAEYVWNEEQDEATLMMQGENVSISWIQEGNTMTSNYRIPSETECMICHKFNSEPIPIGLKPQNINVDYDFGEGPENQIQYLISEGLITSNVPATINTVVNYSDNSAPLEERIRSYLDINCAHCHREGSHCSYRPLRLAYSETDDEENMGVCVEPDEFINTALMHIISPGNKDRSVLHYRLQSTNQNEMMPLLGRSIVHTEGLQLIEDYINTLTGNCN
jgi:uncharacterized repeat protein (TIGR03806 family)